MSSVDDIITRAWVQIAPYSGAKLRLTDMLTLFNIMEDLTRCKILSEEYREFLVEFILECPDTEVDHNQFKSLIERLFESSFENIIRGNLMARTREGYENTNNYDQDFTQTMNLESSKFNEFMQRDSIDEKEDILRKRISELESMISKSQIRGPKDDRVTSKMKDILIGYYKSLDSISRVSYISGDMTNVNVTNPLIRRLKNGIDKQDVLIKELKRKVGDDKPDGFFSFIRYKINSIYYFVWKIFRIPYYILTCFLIINILAYLLFDDNDGEVYDSGSNEAYWG